jgi:choline kinase
MDAGNGEEVISKRSDIDVNRVEALEREVRIWSPACSVFWALWGIVQAEGQAAAIVEGRGADESDFDYLVSRGKIRR